MKSWKHKATQQINSKEKLLLSLWKDWTSIKMSTVGHLGFLTNSLWLIVIDHKYFFPSIEKIKTHLATSAMTFINLSQVLWTVLNNNDTEDKKKKKTVSA